MLIDQTGWYLFNHTFVVYSYILWLSVQSAEADCVWSHVASDLLPAMWVMGSPRVLAVFKPVLRAVHRQPHIQQWICKRVFISFHPWSRIAFPTIHDVPNHPRKPRLFRSTEHRKWTLFSSEGKNSCRVRLLILQSEAPTFSWRNRNTTAESWALYYKASSAVPEYLYISSLHNRINTVVTDSISTW